MLLAELEQGTVEWVPNFDGTLKEPAFLPARLPHISAQWRDGDCGWYGHRHSAAQCAEVANACIELLDNPAASLGELMNHIQGPDYPTSAEIITPRSDIRKIYETGRAPSACGPCIRSRDGEIVIMALPHQASGAKILEQIAAQMQAKSCPWSPTCGMRPITRIRPGS